MTHEEAKALYPEFASEAETTIPSPLWYLTDPNLPMLERVPDSAAPTQSVPSFYAALGQPLTPEILDKAADVLRAQDLGVPAKAAPWSTPLTAVITDIEPEAPLAGIQAQADNLRKLAPKTNRLTRRAGAAQGRSAAFKKLLKASTRAATITMKTAAGIVLKEWADEAKEAVPSDPELQISDQVVGPEFISK